MCACFFSKYSTNLLRTFSTGQSTGEDDDIMRSAVGARAGDARRTTKRVAVATAGRARPVHKRKLAARFVRVAMVMINSNVAASLGAHGGISRLQGEFVRGGGVALSFVAVAAVCDARKTLTGIEFANRIPSPVSLSACEIRGATQTRTNDARVAPTDRLHSCIEHSLPVFIAPCTK